MSRSDSSVDLDSGRRSGGTAAGGAPRSRPPRRPRRRARSGPSARGRRVGHGCPFFAGRPREHIARGAVSSTPLGRASDARRRLAVARGGRGGGASRPRGRPSVLRRTSRRRGRRTRAARGSVPRRRRSCRRRRRRLSCGIASSKSTAASGPRRSGSRVRPRCSGRGRGRRAFLARARAPRASKSYRGRRRCDLCRGLRGGARAFARRGKARRRARNRVRTLHSGEFSGECPSPQQTFYGAPLARERRATSRASSYRDPRYGDDAARRRGPRGGRRGRRGDAAAFYALGPRWRAATTTSTRRRATSSAVGARSRRGDFESGPTPAPGPSGGALGDDAAKDGPGASRPRCSGDWLAPPVVEPPRSAARRRIQARRGGRRPE